MSYVHIPGTPPAAPEPAVQPPPQPQRMQSAGPWIAGILAAFGVGTVLGVVVGGDLDQSATTPAADRPPAARPAADPPERDYYEPTVDDFDLEVETVEKHCFGSAGCNVTVQIVPSYSGGQLDPTETYRVVYEIRGTEDAYVSNMTVRGDSYTVEDEAFVGTTGADVELTAVVTSVAHA